VTGPGVVVRLRVSDTVLVVVWVVRVDIMTSVERDEAEWNER
jgi:hypothetical protein